MMLMNGLDGTKVNRLQFQGIEVLEVFRSVRLELATNFDQPDSASIERLLGWVLRYQ